MLVHIPAVLIVIEKAAFGPMRQVLASRETVSGTVIKYSNEKQPGFALMDEQGNLILTVFDKIPKEKTTELGNRVLIARYGAIDGNELDLTSGTWHQHPALIDVRPPSIGSCDAAIKSWERAFSFVEEDTSKGIIGLRKPQLGALHAIHAHWITSSETATVVMPTGTGKTETMLATMVSVPCERILVVVPTDALRTQIADKFETLGLLKVPDSAILAPSALRPVVGTLTSTPKDVLALESFLMRCNVVITTSAILARCGEDIRPAFAKYCSHLFIDEAHHAEAPTWKVFRESFREKCVLQFTATPFREDGKRMDGKVIFVYPLKKAQEDGYFRPIRFREVSEFNSERGDIEIAKAAIKELDSDETGVHIVMARVSDTKRADSIGDLYQGLTNYGVVVIHSKVGKKEVEERKKKLLSGEARIVVCADMLGEGFDMPELKIAAFHDIRKSLPVTLQLAGRFTRSRPDLGNAVFIANTALIEAKDELRALYSQDPDWNALLPVLTRAAVDGEVMSQQFFSGFDIEIGEVPLKDLRPAASMVVYRTDCTKWTPEKFENGIKRGTSRDKLYHSLNKEEKTLVVLSATEGKVQWSDVAAIRELNWELFIAIWDSDNELLYLHGSGINGEYKEIAKALCGTNVQLVVAPEVFKCFYDVNRLVFNNVGLEEHLGRQVRFTGRMGSDVESRISEAVRRTAKEAVLAGVGYSGGEKVSVGAAKRGRVWSALRLQVDSFGKWAKAIGAKIANDTIDYSTVLAGTLKPQIVDDIPAKTAIAVDWPHKIWEKNEYVVSFRHPMHLATSSTFVNINIIEGDDKAPFYIRLSSDLWESIYMLVIIKRKEFVDYEFKRVSGDAIQIQMGAADFRLVEEYFTDCPPIVWFGDGSSLEGYEYTELPNKDLLPFRLDRLLPLDWTGVDIKKESQGEKKVAGTIQYRMIERLKENKELSLIFDDDGSGEAADIVTIRVVDEEVRKYLEVELYHLKYSGKKPGGRVDDLYVVCGQAQRSANWLTNRDRKTDFFTHLLKRNDKRVKEGKSSRIELGTVEDLIMFKEISRHHDVRLKVIVVQPGLSKKDASESQLMLFAVTERYLSDTYEIPFRVICSD